MILGEMILGEMILGEMILGEMILGEMILGEMILGEMILGEILGAEMNLQKTTNVSTPTVKILKKVGFRHFSWHCKKLLTGLS